MKAYQFYTSVASKSNNRFSVDAKKYIGELDGKLSETYKILAATRALIMGNKEVPLVQIIEKLFDAIENDDYQNAISLARLVSEQNSPIGHAILGLMYLHGYGGLAKDQDEANILFKRSCKESDFKSCLYHVDILFEMGRVKEAKEILKKINESTFTYVAEKLYLAKLLLKASRVVEAERIVLAVLEKMPSDDNAKSLLVTIRNGSIHGL
jgi:TPR repeat protein